MATWLLPPVQQLQDGGASGADKAPSRKQSLATPEPVVSAPVGAGAGFEMVPLVSADSIAATAAATTSAGGDAGAGAASGSTTTAPAPSTKKAKAKKPTELELSKHKQSQFISFSRCRPQVILKLIHFIC